MKVKIANYGANLVEFDSIPSSLGLKRGVWGTGGTGEEPVSRSLVQSIGQ